MKKFFGALVAFLVLHAPTDAADKIRVGYPAPIANFLTLPLAQKRGFFKEEGLDAEIVRIRPPASYAALVNGDIDYYSAITPVVGAVIRALPVKVVACSVTGSQDTLVARPEFKSVKELKGKTIAVSTPGATPTAMTRLVLKTFRP